MLHAAASPFELSSARGTAALRLAGLLLAAVVVAGCGARISTPDDSRQAARRVQGATVDATTDVESEVVFLEPMLIQVVPAEAGDEGPRTVAIDLPQLFAEANDYLLADDFSNAVRLYQILLEHFTDPTWLQVVWCNLGLAYEGLRDWDQAAAAYRQVLSIALASDDGTWAHYRLAEVYAQLGLFERVPALMEAVVPRPGQPVASRVEGHLRWGFALLELRDFAAAEQQFRRALQVNNSVRQGYDPAQPDPLRTPLDPGDGRIAQAHFGLGRVFHELFLEIRLVLPEDRLTRDLVDKGQLFDQAQAAYLDGVRTGNVVWGPACGYLVGQLHEDFYFDVLATEVPTDFNELELEVYFEELRNFLRPAMEKAATIYENNLAMAYRLNAQGAWVEDTLAAIQRVQDYLFHQTGWLDEQTLILRQQHPRSARYAAGMQFRTDRSSPPQTR